MARCAHCQAEVPQDADTCPRCGQLAVGETDDLLGREVLGRYRIVRMLAEGGMGRVYLAEQAVGTVARRVAIKILRKQLGSDKQLVARFAREAETLVRLTHPNTVQLFDFGPLPDGTLALVMEYVAGHSLARELLDGPLSLARTERVLTQVCGALQEAHAHGIVHRDLKPDNLLIADRIGHGDFIKVLDFGIAKVSSEDPAPSSKLTQQGMVIGTPPYMSPEQFSGEPVDARSDIYSLGVIAFEALTGRLPFAANTPWEWASKHLTSPPQELPLDAIQGIAARHGDAIRKALAKRADDRPQTVAEFLALFIGGGTESARVPVREPTREAGTQPAVTAADTPATNPMVTASKRPYWVAAVITTVLLALGVFAIARHGRPAQDATRTPPAPPALAAPTDLTTSTAALPTGSALPEQGAQAMPSARPAREERTTSERSGRVRRRDRETGEPTATVPSPYVASARRGDSAAVPARADAARSAPLGSDLRQRISQIEAASGGRIETAVGLYQAAAGRYGAGSPPLHALRAKLASGGEARLRELLSAGRCAQAQALYRALRAISAAPQGNSLFGPGCPRP